MAGEIRGRREEIEREIAKAAELRALHSALQLHNINNTSPAPVTASSPPLPHQHHHYFSPHDYPVFTPSYDDEPLPGYRHLQLDSGALSDYWDGYGIAEGNTASGITSRIPNEDDDNDNGIEVNNSSGKKAGLINSELPHICPAPEDQISTAGSCTNNINNVSVLKTSPGTDFYKSSRRNSLGDFRTGTDSSSSCNKCKPALINSDSNSNGMVTKSRHFNTVVVPLTDSHSSLTHPKHRGGSTFSRFFHRLKKKNKNENSSPIRAESEDVSSQVYKDFAMMSIERLKRDLIQANESRDAALSEVLDMKSSFGELKQKLEGLETYCEELKKALREAIHTKNNNHNNHFQILENRGIPVDENMENMLPVSEEVMVEGFMQVVSEARLSVKHFCKILVSQIDETDSLLVENLDLLLQPYKLSLNSKYTKAVLYHLEAIINQALYQDFENPVFVKNGCPKVLDPRQHKQAQFTQFVALRNLSWNEVLRRGTKFYSDEFSKFCDQKMSLIISTLSWSRPWSEQLLQSFFVASKCIWLLHLLAFSFDPALGILRVEDNRSFDGHYMEDIIMDNKQQQRSQGPSRVKIMVMPGFYVHERVLKSKVLCRYKSM